MMFRFESRAFQQTAETLQNACSDLDQYEEVLRGISLAWSRDPDRPAPRERLRRELDRLEERETALNMMKRKLESAARLYEAAENRILDSAEETEGTGDLSGDPFYQDIRYGEDSSQKEPKADARLDFDISKLADLLLRHLKRRRGGYLPFRPLIYILLPGRLHPHLRPFYPWRYRPHPLPGPHPMPGREPFIPDPYVFHPRRHWPSWRRRILIRPFRPVRPPVYLPPAVLFEAVTAWRDEGSTRTLQPVGIDSAQRQAERARISKLFGRLP